MNKTTQCQKILAYIDKHGGITPLEALTEIGCMRLAARIADLEKVGHEFTHTMITRKTEDGSERFMRYGRA